MRNIIVILAVATLAACEDSTGDWSGECDIGEFEIDVTLSVTDEEGDISGTGTLSYTHIDEEFSEDADVRGTRDGDAVSLELQPDTVGEMEIDGVIDADSLSGTCTWATAVGTAALER